MSKAQVLYICTRIHTALLICALSVILLTPCAIFSKCMQSNDVHILGVTRTANPKVTNARFHCGVGLWDVGAMAGELVARWRDVLGNVAVCGATQALHVTEDKDGNYMYGGISAGKEWAHCSSLNRWLRGKWWRALWPTAVAIRQGEHPDEQRGAVLTGEIFCPCRGCSSRQAQLDCHHLQQMGEWRVAPKLHPRA